jgi:hypothetical protein
MSHRKTDLGIPRRSKSAKVVLDLRANPQSTSQTMRGGRRPSDTRFGQIFDLGPGPTTEPEKTAFYRGFKNFTEQVGEPRARRTQEVFSEGSVKPKIPSKNSIALWATPARAGFSYLTRIVILLEMTGGSNG